MRVCLFEDAAVEDLYPLTQTRPMFDLLCGITPLGAKQCRAFRAASVGVWLRPHLELLFRQQRPHTAVNDRVWLADAPTALVNSRWLPPVDFVRPTEPGVGLVDGEVAYALLEPVHLRRLVHAPLGDCLAEWRGDLPWHAGGGTLVRQPWDLLTHNAEQLTRDAQRRPSTPLAPLSVTGPRKHLHISPSARLEAHVHANTTAGPIVIAAGAVIHAFSRLEGPCYVGPLTQVFGAKVRAGTSLGPQCRIGGEIEASIIQGFTNKYHDGFLGHSVLGKWINLAAGTHTSDLRLDYGPVTAYRHGRAIPTGEAKIGSFLGDHVRTGLGTLMNAGTLAGAFAQLLPTGTLGPRCVPSFVRSDTRGLSELDDVTALLTTAERVLVRRKCAYSAAQAELYRELFARTQAERAHALRDAEIRGLRRAG